MIKQLPNNTARGFIAPLYPNLHPHDTGLGTIGRIDHAHLTHDSIIKMHPHINDEILSYFRTGRAEHFDSEGIHDTAHATRLMLMKAGRYFEHEEKIFGENPAFEGLQIFIRPAQKDLTPSVNFYDLSSVYSDNEWRLLASPNAQNGLQFSSQSWVYDVRLTQHQLQLPDFNENLTYLLYVFQGEIVLNNQTLIKRDSVIIQGENPVISSDKGAELVLFVTDENSEYFAGGMFSGNRFQAA